MSSSPSRLRPSVFVLLLLSAMQLATSESARACSIETFPFLYALESRCLASISPSPPLKVDGNIVDRLLNCKHQQGFTSVLFYASWCRFSNSILPTFNALSTMFPQISHAAVEQFSTLPSAALSLSVWLPACVRKRLKALEFLLVPSFLLLLVARKLVFKVWYPLPSIILVNGTSRTRYRGPKTLLSLIRFYETNTGIQSVQSPVSDPPESMHSSAVSIMQFSGLPSLKEMTSSEPYLVFSVLFVCLRTLLMVLPGLPSYLKGLWLSCFPCLKLKIFGEITQIWGHIVEVVDLRRIWTKMRSSKARSFHDRSVRVWASLLASVSLEESSSARFSS